MGESDSFGAGSPLYPSLTLLKYSSIGSLIWQRVWGWAPCCGITADDFGYAIALDSSGNIYITGYAFSNTKTIPILKFDPNGNLLWQKVWGALSNSENGYGIAVDSSGNVYVTGSAYVYGGGSLDLILLKLDSNGNLLWQRSWGGTSSDEGYGVAVDSSGSVYVTGYTGSFGFTGFAAILLKFSSAGNLLWEKTWGGTYEAGQSVAVDPSGNVYVAGYTNHFGAGNYDMLILKFDGSSGLLWSRTWGGPGNDQAFNVAIDPVGNIYVAGQTNSTGSGGYDVALLKLNSGGGLLSHVTWGGSQDDWGRGVAVDSYGDALVTGVAFGAPPYGLTLTGNGTLGMPAGLTGPYGNNTAATHNYTLKDMNGTVLIPSGSETYAGSWESFLFKYGPIPTVTFQTNPPSCGTITFNGTTFINGGSANFMYGNYTLAAISGPGCVFTNWNGTAMASLSLTDHLRKALVITVTGPGTVIANFVKITSTPLTPDALLFASLTSLTILFKRRWRSRVSTDMADQQNSLSAS